MPKTSLEVITAAYRRMQVAAEDLDLTADQQDIGYDYLEALLDELANEGFTSFTDIEALPDWSYIGLAQMLSQDLAPNYGRERVETQWFSGMRRLRRHEFPDDRPLRGDLDDDGALSEGEAEADKRAQFY